MTIASTLNIAKEALLTQQTAITVTGHNIANVNTPGYSRQVLDLSAPPATPTGAGYIGNGVQADSVVRQYDKFMLQRLMDQNATLSNLTSQQQSMQVISTTFNEVPGKAVNELLSNFWASWQSLSNNPELSSNRQTVVQQGQILSEQLQSMSAQLAQARSDNSLSLKSSVQSVNSITQQIADLNAKITSSETTKQQQNDLRDTRDGLLKSLAGYVNVHYFEMANGADTVIMADGHSLVNGNQSWQLDWSNNGLQWVNPNPGTGVSTSTTLNSSTYMGGSIGGLLETNSQLTEGNPDNYVGRLNSLANSIIRTVNQQHSQGVGTTSFSDVLTSSEQAGNATLLNTTVDTRTAADTLAAGTFTLNGRSVGRIDGSVVTYGQAMGKAASAASAINAASAGVLAKLTTQVAGGAVTPMTAAENGSILSFTVNGVAVSYTVDTTSASNDTNSTILAQHLAGAINSAIGAHNLANQPQVTISAAVGNGGNGGAQDAIVLKNTNQGDESSITIGALNSVDSLGNPSNSIAKAGLTAGTQVADATHNTGELSLFAQGAISIDGGSDDTSLAQLGWAGMITYSNQAVAANTSGSPSITTFTLNNQNFTVSVPAGSSAAQGAQLAVNAINKLATTTGVTATVGDGTNGGPLNSVVFSSQTANLAVSNYTVTSGPDVLGFSNFTKKGVAAADPSPGDGKLTYTAADNSVTHSLMDLNYADSLKTDGGSFNLWIYNSDGTLALAQPVSISLTRAYTLDDVAQTINASINQAAHTSNPWVKASVVGNSLTLTPDGSHNFAFGNDTSNFLASVGLNTFFTGSSAANIGVNSTVANNLNDVAAGQVNQYGEIFAGDNSNALKITNIQGDASVTYTGRGTQTDTLDGFYNSLIAEVGLKGQNVSSELTYNTQVNDQLNQIRDSTSGVSLDEEMANLIKFQHAYSAAAKLISTSDEMMQTLLATIR